MTETTESIVCAGLLTYAVKHKGDYFMEEPHFTYHDIDRNWGKWSEFHHYVGMWANQMRWWVERKLAGGRPRTNGTVAGDLTVRPDGSIAMTFELVNATVLDPNDARAFVASFELPVVKISKDGAGRTIMTEMYLGQVWSEFSDWAKTAIAAYEIGDDYPKHTSMPWTEGKVVNDAGKWLALNEATGEWRKKRKDPKRK